MYEDIRTGPHHVFRIQITLSQPGGQIIPTTVLQAPPPPPGFQTLRRRWSLIMFPLSTLLTQIFQNICISDPILYHNLWSNSSPISTYFLWYYGQQSGFFSSSNTEIFANTTLRNIRRYLPQIGRQFQSSPTKISLFNYKCMYQINHISERIHSQLHNLITFSLFHTSSNVNTRNMFL